MRISHKTVHPFLRRAKSIFSLPAAAYDAQVTQVTQASPRTHRARRFHQGTSDLPEKAWSSDEAGAWLIQEIGRKVSHGNHQLRIFLAESSVQTLRLTK